VGFGTGIERLILNLKDQGVEVPDTAIPFVYVAPLSEGARAAAAGFARALRADGIRVIAGVGTKSLRARLRNADATGARWAALFGDDELRDGTVALRDLSAASPETLATADAIEKIKASATRSEP
jgi:histidyl-tRNA synthetase